MTALSISRIVAKEAIWARLGQLQSRPFDTLRELSDSKEEFKIDGVDVTLSVFREPQKDGSIWVIGQLATPSRPFLFVFSSRHMFGEGFEARSDGSSRVLTERELDYFT